MPHAPRHLPFARLIPIAAIAGLALTTALATSTVAIAAEAASPSESGNGKPVVIPALQTWTGGTGAVTLSRKSRIVVSPADAGALMDITTQLAKDVADVSDLTLSVVRSVARPGDIVLDLDAAAEVGPDTDIARKEGYSLTTDGTTGTSRISARTDTGVFWGTRTLLQILQGRTGHTSIPVGSTTDWPNYALRGFMLDVGRRYFTPEFLRDYVAYMSWYKLNTFQVHLNDNEIQAPGGDWSKAQSAFRLRSDNPRFTGLAAEDGSYSRADWDSIEDAAAAHHVTLVPEIDAPAHSRAFIKFDPSLGLNGGNSDHLDLTKPATTQFMKDVFSEFAPWFRGPSVHFGADEYPREYATEYVKYFNDLAAHVRSLGKHPSAWGSSTVMTGNADGYDRDVTINSWNNGWYGPNEAIRDGYDFINTNDGLLYIVPFAGYYHGKGLDGPWLFANWDPRIFGAANQTVPEGNPHLLGGMSAVWNDLVHADYTAQDVHGLVEPTFGILAQKMWRGVETGQTHASFMAGAGRLGVGPGLTTVQPTLLNPGDPDLALTLSTPPELASGANVLVDLTVRNNHDEQLARPTATLALGEADGLTVHQVGNGPKALLPGQAGTWTFRVSADESVVNSTVALTASVSGTVGRQPVTAATSGTLQTKAAPPAGTVLLSSGATATASSVEANLERLNAAKVNDGDATTRWASGYTDSEWVQLELASPSTVKQVQLDWENACALSYGIDVSVDGTTWTRAATLDESTCASDIINLTTSEPVKFVRMQGIRRASGYGYSIYEFRVHGNTVS